MEVYRYCSTQSPGKKRPDEPGETGMMESAVLGWVSQGSQHEVIAMASCCNKGGNNCHRQACTGTTGITVLRHDLVVVLRGHYGLRRGCLRDNREWSGMDYLANFCASCGISLWEIHNKVTEKPPQ